MNTAGGGKLAYCTKTDQSLIFKRDCISLTFEFEPGGTELLIQFAFAIQFTALCKQMQFTG